MAPEPNEHGVFVQTTETIEHVTRSGARLYVYLVRCAGGWREGVMYAGVWCGGGYAPNIKRPLRASRQEAIDFAAASLRSVFDTQACHEMTGKEVAQRDEVIEWCNGRAQQELFA